MSLMSKPFKVLDSTLREGEQQAGVRFSAKDKVYIMKLLEDFGVDIIEVGHPGISQEDEDICREVVQNSSKAEILMHSRANLDEIRAVKRTGAHWVGIWASFNNISLEAKFSANDISYVAHKAKHAIEEAKRLNLKVRFTIEDASRTPYSTIDKIVEIALSAGADCISIADTVGIFNNKTCKDLVTYLKNKYGCILEVHLHNDLGLSLSNALTAIDCGVDIVDTSVMGIGERAGIVDLIQLATALTKFGYESNLKIEIVENLTKAVSLATGYKPDDTRPIIGRNAFTHTSAYHVKAVLSNPETYEPFDPSLVGRERVLKNFRPAISSPKLPFVPSIKKPFIKGASELKYHTDGPGTRWVHLDSRIDNKASFYVIQRFFEEEMKNTEKHVDKHTHHCDSAFLFWGDTSDGSGLVCCVQINGEEKIIHSPASVFIPAFIEHSYYYIAGKGSFTNIVLSPDYNQSLV